MFPTLTVALTFATLVLGSPSGQTRIVGGHKATDKDSSWMVSVSRYGRHSCGGSLINARTVLTAAHCVLYARVESMKVRVGSKTRSSGGLLVDVESVASHESFEFRTMDFDIGVIRLAATLQFSDTVQPIGLPNYRQNVAPRTRAVIMGWGLYSTYAGSAPEYLRYAEVPVIDQGVCKALMNHSITDRMICAGYLVGGVDACQLDSGGPMVVDNTLIGIVSWGNGCALPGQPGVYTRVSELIPWVYNHLGDVQ